MVLPGYWTLKKTASGHTWAHLTALAWVILLPNATYKTNLDSPTKPTKVTNATSDTNATNTGIGRKHIGYRASKKLLSVCS